MEGEDSTPSIICPHCGHEIRKEAKFCPRCGGKLVIVNYCPQCRNKVEKGERYCSNCGKDLIRRKPVSPTAMEVTPVTQPTPQLTSQPALKRPTGITILCVLWVLGGLWNFFVGLNNLSVDLGVMISGHSFTDQAIITWASWAVPIEASLMLIVMVLGIVQLATIYGFWNRRSWSYSYGIAIPIVGAITNWSSMFLTLTAPPSLGIVANPILPIMSLLFAIIYIAYLRQAHVKEWLRVGAEGHQEETAKALVLPNS